MATKQTHDRPKPDYGRIKQRFAEERDLRQVVDAYPMNIPRYYLDLIDPTDPADPIRKLAVPATEELIVAGAMGETTPDPYGDDKHDKGNGILHKYSYTALVVATEYCSMYCRHCFRKELVVDRDLKLRFDFEEGIEWISEHEEIRDVLITGGDPFILSDQKIEYLIRKLREISHIEMIRFGTRTPIVSSTAIFARFWTARISTWWLSPRRITGTCRSPFGPASRAKTCTARSRSH